jgi:isoleucyl-tRNA synthetase
MAAVQRIVSLGHAARNLHGLKTRQPLAAVTLVTADRGLPALVEPHADLLREELNVKQIRWAADRSVYVRHEVKPVFPKAGPRFGKRMPEVKRALETADGDALAAELEASGKVTVTLAEGPEKLFADEVEVHLVERAGTATQGDRELLVALETALTPDLLAEGLAREFVHWVQQERKKLELDYADRIRIGFAADAAMKAAVDAHLDWIRGETLAVTIEGAVAPEPALTIEKV